MEEHHHAWDETAAERLFSRDRESIEDTSAFKSIFGIKKMVIVDLGCGPGFYSVKLEPFASVLYCIDSSKAMLSAARNNVHGKAVRFIEADSSDTMLPDSSADAVFMANSFHDMDKAGTSAEVIRILKPSSMIVIIDWKKADRNSNVERRGPPESLRMSEEEYLSWFPGFRIGKRFAVGPEHFGIVLVR